MTNNEMIEPLTINNIFNNTDRYQIPYYQRKFAWGKEQITRLLQDIYSSFNEDEDKETPYYIGSLIVKKNSEDKYEVIDGQQRLTVFSLLVRYLQINTTSCILEYKSRKLENLFLKNYYSDNDFYLKDEDQISVLLKNIAEKDDDIKTDDFLNCNEPFITAINYLKTSSLEIEEKEEKKISLDSLQRDEPERFEELKEFISNKVLILRTILPEETNVAAYFEIMNNRGKQLQPEEILKSLIMSSLKNDLNKQKKFSKIWNACYQMNIPIQRSFSPKERDILFHEAWNDILSFDEFNEYFTSVETPSGSFSEKPFKDLYDAPDDPFAKEEVMEEDDVKDDDESNPKYKSIMDFSNFILQVFKILYEEKDEDKIVLDERKLLPMYKRVSEKIVNNEQDTTKFIYYLLFFRTMFDRFILKTEEKDGEANEDENFFWRLLEPIKDTKNTTKLRYNKKSEFSEDFYMILSMLQVTFRNRRYKNYLYQILIYLRKKYESEGSIAKIVSKDGQKEYLASLLKLLNDDFEKRFCEGKKIKWQEISNLGTSTSHFLFNFIDLLYMFAKEYCEEQIDSTDLKEELKLIEDDFVFRYYNSIEHHFARNYFVVKRQQNSNLYSNITPELLDNLGNLILISKSSNSRLSDVSALEKAKERNNDINKGPNRQIIYSKTLKKEDWDKECIETHSANIKALLENREIIMNSVIENFKLPDKDEDK